MPDISMCDNKQCPLAKDCYRSPKSGTKPNGDRQSWLLGISPQTDASGKTTCDYHLELWNRREETPR